MPCPRLNATAAVAVAGSDLQLTYSSDRTPGWTAGRSLETPDVGLGGWSINNLSSLDVKNGVIESGTGERRLVTPIAVTVDGHPGLAVPAPDASEIYVFDPSGRQLRTVDGFTALTTVTFAWDSNGLASVTEPGGRVTRILRDSAGTPVQVVTKRGYRTQLGVLNGWLAAVVDPAGGITHLTTTATGLLEVVRDAAGARTVVRYDTHGLMSSIEGPSGQSLSFDVAQANDGIVVQASTAAGRGWTETITNTDAGTQRTYRTSAGLQTQVTINGATRDVVAPDGTKLHVTLAPDSAWGMNAPLLTVDQTSPAGRTNTAVETRQGSVVDPSLTAQPYSRTVTIGTGSWSVSNDPGTKTLTSADPDGRKVATTYDETGQPLTIAAEGRPQIAYSYDSSGRLVSLTVGSGSDARQWRYAYDLTSGSVTVTDPAGNASILTADPQGNGSTVATASGSEMSLAERDAAGRVTAFGGGTLGLTQLAYRPDGRPDSTTLPPGDGIRYTTYSYDPDGVLTGVSYADASGLSFDHDGGGRVTTDTTNDQTWTLGYDPQTAQLTSYDGSAEDLTTTFDGRSVVKEVWSGVFSATVDRQFDGQSRLTGDNVDGLSPIQYAYDASGALVQAGEMTIVRDPSTGLVTSEKVGSLERTWRYDDFAEVIGETVSSGSSTVYDLSVARDALGRVVHRVETFSDGSSHTQEFAYDDAGRLASTTSDGNKVSYTYDASGNLVSESGAATLSSTFDARGALLSQGARTFKYDAEGRLASVTDSAGTITYEFDSDGTLHQVTLADGTKIAYVSDGLGRRVARLVNGQPSTSFVYADALRPAAELDASGQVASRFVYDSSALSPAYVIRGGKTELVVTDDSGSPRMVVDSATGATTDVIATDAWGRGDKPPTDVPFGHSGGLVDPDTRLIHFGARDYDPSTGRWTAPDPLGYRGGDANQYRYAHDDPTNRVDQGGTCDVVSTGVSAFVGAGDAFGFGFGIVTGGPSLGVYYNWGQGVGAGGSAGVQIGCEEQTEPGNALNQFSGTGTSTDFGIGPVSPGYDQSFNNDGGRSLVGGHFGAGPGLGGAVLETHTHVLCLFGCGGTSEVPSNLDPGPDPALPFNACGGDPPCDPEDPNGPNGDSSGPGSLGGPGSTGDPHLHNAAGFWFDFMAVGEFTALRSDSGDLNIQLRQVPYSTSKWVSVTSQVAISDNGDRLAFNFESSAVVTLAIDGTPTTLHARFNLPHGGFIAPETRSYLIGWPDGSLVRVLRNAKGLDITSRLMPERIGTIHGLLGPYTGDKSQNFIEAKDGTRLAAPGSPGVFNYDDLYRTFGDSWRITQDESLLDYAPGETTATFDDRSFPDPNPPPIDAATASSAEAICKQAGVPDFALAACELDVATTGDPGFALTTASATTGGAATIDQLAQGQVYPIAVGDTVSPGQPSSGAGVVDAANEMDLYPFRLDSPGSVYLRAGANCTALDVTWSLLGPTGQVLTSNEGATGSSICFDLRTYTLPAGTFTIRAAGGSAGETYSFTVTSVAGTNSFPIALDQAVSAGVPAPGAGEITTSGETDIYTFSLAQPQVVYLDSQGDCPNTDISWQLYDATGASVPADSGAHTSALCFDLGSYTLAAGSYTIKVTTTAGVGPYSFEVWSVPATQTFPINLDQAISQGVPASGAGEIAVPGETDLYTFSLPQPEKVYFDSLKCANTNISWRLLGPDGAIVPADSGSSETALCFDQGTYTLSAGNYTIKVTTTDGLDTYTFELWTVPPTLTFPIALDQVVSAGVPGPGAGQLAVPGETDLYTFTVGQAQQVYLQTLGECPNTVISWQLLGADGSVIPAMSGAHETAMCFDLGTFSLPAGTYTIVVSTTDGVDTYSFNVRSSPPST